MALLRVLLGFASAPDHELEETTGHVLGSLFNNPIFPSPPVTHTDLQAALATFTNAIAAQAQGGTAATAAKDQARETLIGLLRSWRGSCRKPSRRMLPTAWRNCFPAGSMR